MKINFLGKRHLDCFFLIDIKSYERMKDDKKAQKIVENVSNKIDVEKTFLFKTELFLWPNYSFVTTSVLDIV